jgi:ring-1,2-phenylacetyl-CoA epoxidase subunit PaaC
VSRPLLEDLSGLGSDERAALRRHLLSLADTKRILGIRYSDWLLGAPSIETGIACSGMAQDEWGHARLIYAMLKELGEDPVPVEHDRAAADYASCDALDAPLDDWAAVVAAMIVVDGALTIALEAFGEGRFAPARSRVPKMLGEEEFHRDLAAAWTRRLGGAGGDARARLGASARQMLPRTLAWLAPDDAAHARLVALGVTGPADDLRERYRERWNPILAACGVESAGVMPERSGWDAVRGRGPGHPGEEAVERARGDRNRALFVE